MRPEEVVLASSEERQHQEHPRVKSEVVPAKISVAVVEDLEKKGPVATYNGIRVFGVTKGITDLSDIPLYYYCKCVRLDLSDEQDRLKYSDLISYTTANNSAINILWQERVVDGGAMIIYMTYYEQIRVVGLVK